MKNKHVTEDKVFHSIFFQKQPPEVFYKKRVVIKVLQSSKENNCAVDSF